MLRIATVRGQRVIVGADLAALYGVKSNRFNEAVKRNLAKLPGTSCSLSRPRSSAL